jgi:hypothetical protein
MVRRAGSGMVPGIGQVTWTVADGARGRRWRAMLLDDDTLFGAVLLETGPDGRVQRLEVTTAAGLLPLHPTGDTLHGNAVRPAGVTHLAFPWSDDRILLVAGTPTTAAAAARVLLGRLGVGEGRTVSGVLVTPALDARSVAFRVARVGPRGWRFVVADTGHEIGVTLDLDGIPAPAEPVSWPLEVDDGA